MKRKIILAALTALVMTAAVGCGYIEDVEPEEDGANLLETTAAEDQTPDNDGEDNGNDDVDGDEDGGDNDDGDNDGGDENTESEEQTEDSAEDTSDSEEETDSVTDEESTADDTGDDDAEPAEGEGDSYYNKEFGMTVPLPRVMKWEEYAQQLMPDFEDNSSLFRPLMDTENADDCVLSIFEYSSDKTLDDFTKAAWDRDYRNAGEGEDTYEVLDTQVLDFGGREGQLITEKLVSPNGEYYYGTIYITYNSGDYIKFRITCLTEDQLNEFCESVKGTTFD